MHGYSVYWVDDAFFKMGHYRFLFQLLLVFSNKNEIFRQTNLKIIHFLPGAEIQTNKFLFMSHLSLDEGSRLQTERFLKWVKHGLFFVYFRYFHMTNIAKN